MAKIDFLTLKLLFMYRKILITLAIIFGSSIIIIGISKFLFSTNDNLSKKNKQVMREMIELPAPNKKGIMSVEESLQKRRSIRQYKNISLSLEQISQVLWAAYGVSDAESFRGIKLKTAPSAGATFPLEIYLMAGNVEGIESGLYKYHPEEHGLTLHLSGDIRDKVASACLGQRMLKDAPASVIYNAVFDRTASRYGQRGIDRYVCMDLGHSAQNVYLQTTAIGLATCAIGAFDDDKLSKIIKPLDNEEVLYLMPFGYAK